MREVSTQAFDNELNHRAGIGKSVSTLPYAEARGKSFEIERDANGLKLSRLRPGPEASGLRVLMFGDSFMEGYDDANTLAQHVYSTLTRKRLGFPIVVMNAGTSSYSPAIFTVQARQLLPQLKPEMAIVVIDQTDLGDDWYRYRNLIERDSTGKIARVKPSPHNVHFIQGLMAAREHSLYLMRFVSKTVHTRIDSPRFVRTYLEETGFTHGDPLYPVKLERDQALRDLRGACDLFEKNVGELAAQLASVLGKDRVLLVVHPHLPQLSTGQEGSRWNNLVAEIVERQAGIFGVHFLDVRDALARSFRGSPADFYWRGDMHFNFRGLEIYGQILGDKIFELAAARWR
jgi:hypothetical protein